MEERPEIVFHSSRHIGFSVAQYHNHGIYEIIEHPNVRFNNWLLMKKGERFSY